MVNFEGQFLEYGCKMTPNLGISEGNPGMVVLYLVQDLWGICWSIFLEITTILSWSHQTEVTMLKLYAILVPGT